MPSQGKTWFEWRLDDLLPHLKPLSMKDGLAAGQGNLSAYHHNGQDYVVKIRPYESVIKRELAFLDAAADISVEVLGIIRRNETNDDIVGFVMPRLKTIEPTEMTLDEKILLFQQIRDLIPQLHEKHHIIHGDIKLSNILLNGNIAKLCDYGVSAWISETVVPTELSIRYASPYRLGSSDTKPRTLIPEEDLYAAGVSIWELFVGETPFGPYGSDEEEFNLCDQIVDGLKVDVERIAFEEARVYVEECLSIECLQH